MQGIDFLQNGIFQSDTGMIAESLWTSHRRERAMAGQRKTLTKTTIVNAILRILSAKGVEIVTAQV